MSRPDRNLTRHRDLRLFTQVLWFFEEIAPPRSRLPPPCASGTRGSNPLISLESVPRSIGEGCEGLERRVGVPVGGLERRVGVPVGVRVGVRECVRVCRVSLASAEPLAKGLRTLAPRLCGAELVSAPSCLEARAAAAVREHCREHSRVGVPPLLAALAGDLRRRSRGVCLRGICPLSGGSTRLELRSLNGSIGCADSTATCTNSSADSSADCSADPPCVDSCSSSAKSAPASGSASGSASSLATATRESDSRESEYWSYKYSESLVTVTPESSENWRLSCSSRDV